MMGEEKAIYASMMVLREDAIDRGFQEAAIVYGWSAISLAGEMTGQTGTFTRALMRSVKIIASGLPLPPPPTGE